ncbi:hypothetical protein EPO05_07175 [Patescibacteria group bacterium]|nr:MAG: hypothetical protein EPO05_07175 [Patescibacteria group bacterium]
MKSLLYRIKSKVTGKELVHVTRRKRSQHGFVVTDPDGEQTTCQTKGEAIELTIAPDGTIRAVKSDIFPLDEFGQITTRRASHVWPCHSWKRFAFRLLRFLFRERGHVAAWCRHWRGPWEVRFTERPNVVVFTHPSRRVCLDWEIQRLNERLAQ